MNWIDWLMKVRYLQVTKEVAELTTDWPTCACGDHSRKLQP